MLKFGRGKRYFSVIVFLHWVQGKLILLLSVSQEELSEKVGVSVKHLSAIERGLTFVSAELLEKLSITLETPIFCFFVKDKEIFCNDTILNTLDGIMGRPL